MGYIVSVLFLWIINPFIFKIRAKEIGVLGVQILLMHIMMISQVSSVTNISHPETLEKPRDLTLFYSNLNLFYFVNNQSFGVKIPLAHFFYQSGPSISVFLQRIKIKNHVSILRY